MEKKNDILKFRVDTELFEALCYVEEETGLSKSDILREALSLYLKMQKLYRDSRYIKPPKKKTAKV